LYAHVLDPVISCCSDVQIGQLLQDALQEKYTCKPLPFVIGNHLHLSLNTIDDPPTVGQETFDPVTHQVSPC
jgi:hypothetical protein